MREHDNIAIFKGEQLNPPVDLFIPPDAFEIWLDQFEGPLDLLLHIIRKNNFDILDIPISDITTQYMSYIDYLEEERFELASEYLVMAAWLAEIKSRILLPTPEVDDIEEELDPRQELIRRLQIYAQYKEAANQLSQQAIFYRDTFPVSPETPNIVIETPAPTIELSQLLQALEKIIARANLHQKHQVESEKISINDRIDEIMDRLSPEKPLPFTELINPAEGRYGITISFLSLLELARKQQILLTQEEAYSDILITLYRE
ncbi:segregation and condensation protein A [Ignatzschineria cameli]|uniref:Segregation and condensation protein A n=1 Tax=Ignatzschineria cameli TaxID=2182793 RepID=A0ABX5L347_9GAMM|nr:segregation/condensation protein A [Ignatzschineria cameli]PWD92019.1 segregation/condensation protein A [Ignatzschineria cameli]PWD93396.1 segregation/condensation protein A [Ignatzschineria cameli]PWD94138.1 segregation/condensation protein A [Ignatzschineria cameli]